jgi:hypothetical protein
MSRRITYGHAQYNVTENTRPVGTGQVRTRDPKRPAKQVLERRTSQTRPPTARP